MREIEALADYLKRHREIRSVLVVTSAVHQRRVRMCCREILPREVHFQMAATKTVREPRASFLEFGTEMVKLAGYRVLLGFRWRARV